MSDQSSPTPKPKVGSLRDRIAAFEKSASTGPAPGPAPAPRPKPAGFATWKPKVPSPPSSPPANVTTHAAGSPAASSSKAAGLSASDAKESITMGGSLKERMAALQGKGAFGAPPPVAPKPAVEKPKWKPPPVVQAPVDDEDHVGEDSTAAIAAAVERTVSPPTSVKSPEGVVEVQEPSTEAGKSATPAPGPTGDNNEEAAPDPEDEERERRAAIAARMARLGGARLGMAPPVFGKKPPVRRPTQEEPKPAAEESVTGELSSHEPVKSDEQILPHVEVISKSSIASPPESQPSSDYFPIRKNSESASVLSAESTESHPAKSPSSMPVPAVPRRAGPPRKKPIKPATPPPEVPEEASGEPPVLAVAEVSEEKFEELDSETEKAKPENPLVAPAREEPPYTMEKEEGQKVDDHDQLETTEKHEEIAEPSSTKEELKTIIAELKEPDDHSEVLLPPSQLADHPTSHPEPISATQSPPSSRIEPTAEDDLDDGDGLSPTSELAIAPSIPTSIAPTEAPEPPIESAPVKDSVTEPITSPPTTDIAEEDEAAEEEARKKRVAERLAKMGGVNPFAPPPARVTSPPKVDPTSPPLLPASASPPLDAALSRSPSPEELQLSYKEASQHSTQETPKESQVETKVESGDFDGESEDEVSDYGSEPPSTSDQHEKPKAPSNISHPQQFEAHPPPPVSSKRLSGQAVQVQQYGREDDNGSDDGEARNIPTHIAHPAESVRKSPVIHHEAPSPPGRPVQPPRRIVPQAPEEDEVEEEYQTDEEADERLAQSHLFIPPPTGRGQGGVIMPDRSHFQDENDGEGDGSEDDSPPLPVPHRRSLEVPEPRIIPSRSIPQPPPSDDDSDVESDHDGRALPVPPPHAPTGPPPRSIPPPPPPPAHLAPESAPTSEPDFDSRSPSPDRRAPSVSVLKSEEILDEEEGDPIDPAFHSPSRRGSSVNLFAEAQAQAEATSTQPSPPAPPAHAHSMHTSPPPTRSLPPAHALPEVHSPPPAVVPEESPAEDVEEGTEDPEQLRRKTIAERMAKLGGIRFGAVPMPTPPNRPPPPPRQEEGGQQEVEGSAPAEVEESSGELTEEEEERARKERISAKLAHMGGMRIGMMPMGGLAPQRSHVLREEPAAPSPPSTTHAPPPSRAIPPSRPPPPQAQDTDSEIASDDGVKVEAEESEIEEVSYEDAQPEEAPPIPSRSGRTAHRQESTEKATSPPPPPGRPPVPTAVPGRRSSVQTTRSISSTSTAENPPQRKHSSYMPPSEYVMVEEPISQEDAPPPPARPTSRAPPSRSAPQQPQATDPSDSISSQWELPSIPTPKIDFGGSADLSLSWSDAGDSISPTLGSSSEPAPPGKQPERAMGSDSTSHKPMSADDLMMVWGRVGVQVCEVATTLFEKSKKTLIGDGSYIGFLKAVLADVPNAFPISPDSGDYGYLIYVQNGAAVQKRVSDIMPGDIVEIHDGKLKGHKGLQTYHQNVGGAGEVMVGVVGEFEAKKSKIRVFHANQHVGQQTVESVSYRLEDLKSGIVKVYRVLEV